MKRMFFERTPNGEATVALEQLCGASPAVDDSWLPVDLLFVHEDLLGHGVDNTDVAASLRLFLRPVEFVGERCG